MHGENAIKNLESKHSGLDYVSMLMDLDKKLWKLNIVDMNHARNLDLGKRIGEINSFLKKVSNLDLKDSDRKSLLQRGEDYKNKAQLYSMLEHGTPRILTSSVHMCPTLRDIIHEAYNIPGARGACPVIEFLKPLVAEFKCPYSSQS